MTEQEIGVLMKFYNVTSKTQLINAQAQHVIKLQDKLQVMKHITHFINDTFVKRKPQIR